MKNKILIVEDETTTAKYLSDALESEGFLVESAENGTIGLDKIKNEKFDLIVLDLKMPGKNGDEVLAEIRNINPFLQVVVYTNYTEPSIMAKLMNLGVDGFITKGAGADLWGTVELIKSKFHPLDDAKKKELLERLFKQIAKTDDNEVHA